LYLLDNGATRVVLTQPLHHIKYKIKQKKKKILTKVWGLQQQGDGSTTTHIKNKTKWM
jgi:hypothetical protein